MEEREEWFEQKQGAAQLELRGGPLELALFVGSKPLVYDAADCGGSVGRFTVLLPEPPNISAVRRIESNATKGFRSQQALSQQIAPILALLPNGKYRLALTEVLRGSDFWDVAHPSGDLCRGYWPMGDGYEHVHWLIPTQRDEDLQDERVYFYMEQMGRGAQPTLILLGSKEHDAWFVLDGHHKLMASYLNGFRLRALLIEFQELVPIPLAEARETLQGVPEMARDYLRWKPD